MKNKKKLKDNLNKLTPGTTTHTKLLEEHNAVTYAYFANHEKVLQYFDLKFPMIYESFGIYQTYRGAVSKELVSLIICLSKGNDNSYISNLISSMRSLKRSANELSFCKYCNLLQLRVNS